MVGNVGRFGRGVGTCLVLVISCVVWLLMTFVWYAHEWLDSVVAYLSLIYL